MPSISPPHSKQGLNIAFIGLNYKAQTACAEYLRKKHGFKRADMDDGVKYFLRQMYDYNGWKKIHITERRRFYDSIYKTDPNIFISHIKSRVRKSENDIVVADVRYVNELRALEEMDFKVVRVTVPHHSKVGVYVKGAASGTTALSVLYDKQFAIKYNVDFSVNVTKLSDLPRIIPPMLEHMGYNLTKDE